MLRLEDPPGEWVGLMDPVIPNGTVAGYFTLADARALDIMGWNMSSEPIVGPPHPDAIAPPDRQPDASLTPTFEWAVSPGADVVDLYVFRGTVVDNHEKVYEVVDISPNVTMHTLPVGILEPGTTYMWFLTAVNDIGLAYSEQRTFTTEGSCPADFNGDGQLTVADYTAFQAAFQAGDPRADFNGDGQLTVADYTAFQAAFQAGCR